MVRHYAFGGTSIDIDGYNCAYGTQNTIYLSSTLKSNGLEELGDYVDSICSNPN